MKSTQFQTFGWLVAALLAGVIFGGGFGQGNEKFGVVDIGKVLDNSDFGKLNVTTTNSMAAARQGLLDFVTNTRVITSEQAARLKDLSLKLDITNEEKTELDRIKADVTAADKRYKELIVKTNLTPEDRNLLDDYNRRAQVMDETAKRWLAEFERDMQAFQEKQVNTGLDKVRTAIIDTAKGQGFTLIFTSQAVPYAANDLTDAVTKAMNAKK